MAIIKLNITTVGVTDYLVIVARKVSEPLVIAAELSLSPADLAGSNNVVLPDAGELDATNYYIDYYESSDGIAHDSLISRIVLDAKNDKPISETRYYLTGGGRLNGDGILIDPADGGTRLPDPYLDGKNLTKVQKEEPGRALFPPGIDLPAEYQPHAGGGGIDLLQGKTFNEGEGVVVEITYTFNFDTSAPSGTGLYGNVILLTGNTSLTPTHRSARLKCESNASARMVITMEDIDTVPLKTAYYFNSNGGAQNQVRILPFETGQKFRLDGDLYDELSIGKGEWVHVEKWGDEWEVISRAEGLIRVGERIMKQLKDVNNAKPEDSAQYDGDDWPRIWYWLNHELPANSKVTVNFTTIGFVRPDATKMMFMVHPTLKKFMMPDARGLVIKSLKDYNTFIDADRLNGSPGGVELSSVGQHDHDVVIPPEATSRTANGVGRIPLGSENTEPSGSVPFKTQNTGTGITSETKVRNGGDIFLRCF